MVINQPLENKPIADQPLRNQLAYLKSIALGEEVLFNELVKTYTSRLFSSAFYITKNKQAAEDIVQEAFLKLWRKREELTGENIGGWLYRVVIHLAYKHNKKESRKNEIINSLKAGRQDAYCEVEECLVHKQALELFDEIYSRLPKKQREVYHLSHNAGLDREEIANRLNISTYTVRNHLVKAIQFIKEHVTGVCLALLFFLFNNLFFDKSGSNIKSRDLYKINRTPGKKTTGNPVDYFMGNNPVSVIKKPLEAQPFKTS